MQFHRYQLASVEHIPSRRNSASNWIAIALVLFGCTTPASTPDQTAPTESVTPAPVDARPETADLSQEESEPDETTEIDTESNDAPIVGEVSTKEIEFESGGVTLTGEFFEPTDADAKTMGVLIVHEWGPWDRYGTARDSFGLRLGSEVQIYRQLARQLAEVGLVVLTYDKRSCVVEATSICKYDRGHISNKELSAEFETDATNALKKLANHPNVDASQLVVIAHGQGAAIAAKLSTTEDVVGTVYLNPYANAPDQVAVYQTQKSIEYLSLASTVEQSRMKDLYADKKKALQTELEAQQSTFAAIRDGNVVEVAFGMPGETWARFVSAHDNFLQTIRSSAKPALIVAGDALTNASDPRDLWRGLSNENDVLTYVEVAGMSQLLVPIYDTPKLSAPLVEATLEFLSGAN